MVRVIFGLPVVLSWFYITTETSAGSFNLCTLHFIRMTSSSTVLLIVQTFTGFIRNVESLPSDISEPFHSRLSQMFLLIYRQALVEVSFCYSIKGV